MKKKHIFILILLLTSQLTAFAQKPVVQPADTAKSQKGLTKQQLKTEAEEVLEGKTKARFFQSLTVGVDLVGPVMQVLSSQYDYQAFAQMNIKGQYLPVFELGYGRADKEDYYSKVKYKAKAPFFRIGCDYNILKNKVDDYRLTVGLRYGFTSFNYDTSTPTDSLKTVFADTSGKCTLHWAEVVVGVDAKVWGPLHMGWSVRYRRRLKCSYDDKEPLYAPGFGNAVESARWMALYTIGLQI